ncbi:MAG: xanthine dehydrogenase accessory protein XdhC [Burkholderiaceae bacterium]|uniref:Xanthine dehydrogenase accessory protein XdhC n=1 Tax=Cupriavidus metallidurans TaxID=119219 RepID=A0A482IMD6_9BURK|nr:MULTISPECIES: xanthine dehydrogenase accessory protein XdhC [Cupriavidus]KWR79698.1 xanthine dehydrogenase accessory protein XdhC [Cupriavidus sp. SHE]PCH58528.1 MAG: xanthine dehydrogenase accessory protein XdhC [Burkholderiaceae bacterium]QBP09062.1 xanthine dehydrogenase accessory protein XdhC [Cupriavidus metallidurans]QWC89492.1 xanthine dehydrogenase accessory protein XdhC [Cupriavidus metallidurans]
MQDAPLKPFRFADATRWVRAGVPVAMVTIVEVKGSAPREAGIRMLVTADDLVGTIGGGHLEWRGMDIAREMIAKGENGEQRRIERIALGPALGQCCGGVVRLAFEVLTHDDLAWLDAVESAFAAGKALARHVPVTGAVRTEASRDLLPSVQLADDDSWTDTLVPDDMHVVLFGAGHVGHALVKVLATLPCRVHWVDERDTLFPAGLPENVEAEATDTAEAVVDQAPAGSYFLVMTHSHALDQTLCERIFRRTDFAYFGLIGSKTKRAKFEHRMAEHGIDAARFPEMTCPMGVSGITDKAPAMIAVAIVAQLLQVRDQRAAALAASRREAVHP